MNKKGRILLVSLIIISIIFISGKYILDSNLLVNRMFKDPIEPVFDYSFRPMDDMISPEEMEDDLFQLKRDLEEVHPKTRDGLSAEIQSAFDDAMVAIQEPRTILEFTTITSELASMLEDAHTSVNAVYAKDLALPMDIKIIDEKFYVLQGNDLEAGDELVSIGGIPLEEIYQVSKKRIPSENIYWTNLLFENYAILESTLVEMGGEIDNGGTEVLVNRNGNEIRESLYYGDLQFQPIAVDGDYKRYKTYPEDNAYNTQFSYYIDIENDLCHFILKSCDNSPEYRQFLENMFDDVDQHKVGNIVVDLRGNPGGNSSVVDEFLRYIDVDEFVTYGGYRRLSQAASDQRGYLKSQGEFRSKPGRQKNDKVKDSSFQGHIYALIDSGTFSSGNWFGVILADSGIGTLIGEPSGNAPSSYGDILFFQLENSKLLYNISYTQWIRPDEETRYEDALYPDYEVKYTIEDYINKKDLPMEKAIELIKSQGN